MVPPYGLLDDLYDHRHPKQVAPEPPVERLAAVGAAAAKKASA